MVTPRGARDMDDEDEWRVVRVKRRSKSNAHVGDARRNQPARPSRGTSNAFHALMDDSPSEENAEAAKEARRPDTARDTRSGGGGKARSRRRDATPGTSKTDGEFGEARPEPPKAPDAHDDGSDTTASNGDPWTKRVNVAATAMLGKLFAPLLRASPVRDDTARQEASDEDANETATVGEQNEAVPRQDNAADADVDDDDDVTVARQSNRAANFVPTSRPAATFAGGSRPGATGSSPGPDRDGACASAKAKDQTEPSPAPASAPPRPASPAERGASGTTENKKNARDENEKKEATRLFRAARVSPGDANGHCELVRAVSFAGPSRAFVTGGWDGCVRRWAWSRDGRRVYSAGPLAAHADRVEFVDAVKQGDGVVDSRRAGLVVTGGRDCSLRVYDIEAASPAPLRKTYTYESVSAGCVNTNGVDVFVGARSGAASVFDVETGQKRLIFSSKKSAGAAHDLEVTAATATSHHGVSFVSGGADGVVKGWDTRVSDRCAFEISLRDALSGRENASKMRVYSVAADDVSVFVGGFAGSIFAFDARKLPSLDDALSTSSSVRDAMTTIPNAPSRRHGGALRAPVAGLARARLDARNDALFSTAAYFDVSRESTQNADFDEKARGLVRVFSVPKNDADVTETCALPNFGGGLVTCLGVRDFNDKDKDEGVAIVAGDVDGGVSAWRSIARDPSDAEDEETDRDALSAEGFSFPSETNAAANAEPEPLTETSDRFTESAVRWDAASVRGVRFGFARDDSDASEDDSEGEGDGDDA